ncbi:MAG TPA: hypothetical protein VLY24_20705 [Bryobacteraceae bacterium]|nr:hypothetical protein [Bryobacteraceae bacterium]
MPLLRIAVGLAVAVLAIALDLPSQNEGLVAHEWGTFTSVAGEDGAAVSWASLAGSADLPCFVAHLRSQGVKYVPGFVRMETPVLYFYSGLPRTVSVHVEFPQGVITEWYPNATRVIPEQTFYSLSKGQIDWDSVEISPADHSKLPASAGMSRYYAARKTDSTPLEIGTEHEKLIFYRGVGNPPVPVQPVFATDGTLDIRNVAPEPIALAILFENQNGNIGYRVVHDLAGLAALQPPELTAHLQDLRDELAGDLESAGLYRKEALAMVETWSDSWFEEGMRLFYIVPREQVNEHLPLIITPQPSALVRVFVARIELLSPAVRQRIEAAIDSGDVSGLTKIGRFLDPFLAQVQRSSARPFDSHVVAKAVRRLALDAKTHSCIE